MAHRPSAPGSVEGGLAPLCRAHTVPVQYSAAGGQLGQLAAVPCRRPPAADHPVSSNVAVNYSIFARSLIFDIFRVFGSKVGQHGPDAWLAPSRHRPFAVSPWMAEGLMLVWRAGACSHDLLAVQPVLHAAWGAAALQFWLPTWLSS